MEQLYYTMSEKGLLLLQVCFEGIHVCRSFTPPSEDAADPSAFWETESGGHRVFWQPGDPIQDLQLWQTGENPEG